ncbi:MAG TPA: MFS transporter [Steroidobacteraceae bacterium]|jgi:PAT family beta-lactamase induction signal transducer AmpG|nr:MFS transporter [Steroidobacteraceae bacterium]
MGTDIIVRDAHRHEYRLPLTENPKPSFWRALGDKRIVAVLLMSFASGMPFNLSGSGFAFQAWLASAGVDLKSIGLFSLVSLPYSIKPLWAPLLDRYVPPFLGRRRGWIVIFQACLAVAIGVMGFSSPTAAPYYLAAIALLMVFLSSSQDIVIDAYRVDTIPASERGVAAAATAFGYRTGSVLASTVLVLIASVTNWHLAFLVIAVFMAATMLSTIWAPEPLTPGQPPRTLASSFWNPLKDLISQKGAWGFLLLVLLYKAGDAFALSLYSAFMIKGVGFSLAELSIAGKANMTVSTITGVTLGGWIYMRWGMFRSLLVFGIGQALTNLLYTVLALSGKKLWLMALATTLDTGIGGMGQAAYVGFLVSLCSSSFSATQYALLSAMSSIPRNVTGYIAGHLVTAIGWPKFFVVTCLTAVPGLILLVILRRPLQELAARDSADAKR